MKFTFHYKGSEIELSNSNTRPIFSVIKESESPLELTKIDGEPVPLSLFQFYRIKGKVLIPISSLKKEFYLKAIKYVTKNNTKNKTVSSELIEEGSLERKPFEYQISNHIVKSKHIRGVVLYDTILTKVFRLVEKLLVSKIIEEKFEEIILPKITPWDTWLKTGHLLSNYSEIVPVSRTKPTEVRDDYYRSYFEEINPSTATKNIGGMTYSQCENFWSQIEDNVGSIIKPKELNLFFDRSGPSYRQERKNISGLKRLAEFRRIELIYLGPLEEVISTTSKLKEMYKQIYYLLGLSPRISKVGSWSDLKEGYSIDFEINFEEELIETNNLSYNSNYYCKKFLSNSNLYSGCSGIGLDRFVYTLVTKYGIEETTSLLEKLTK